MSQVKWAIEDAAATQEARQTKLMDELNSEKDRFDKAIEQMQWDLRRIKTFGDFSDWEENSGAANDLYDTIQGRYPLCKRTRWLYVYYTLVSRY